MGKGVRGECGREVSSHGMACCGHVVALLMSGFRGDSEDSKIDIGEIPLLAAYGASTITRVTSRLAFRKLGRGVVTGDMLSEIGSAFVEVFGTAGEKGWKGDDVKL